MHSHSTSNGTGASATIKNLLQYPVRFETDYLISCSHEAGEWLFGKKACQSDRYLYLPNAINLDTYRFDASRRERYRRELGLNGCTVFGHVGRLNTAKNHRFLIEAFALIHQRNESAKLLLVGDGELREEISGLIRDAGLSGCVLMLGDRSDVPSLLQAMDVFLFPSLWEGLPVTVVEALASGLPCYVSDAITHDIDICDEVVRLPIDDVGVWADKVGGIVRPGRVDAIEDVRRSGFDITSSVRTLTSVYEDALRIAGKRKESRRSLGGAC